MSAAKNLDLLSAAAQVGLFARRSSAGALTFYTAGETPRAPRAPCLVVICDLVLMQCLLGDAHAAVSCQVQLGAPMSAAARMSLFAQLRRLRHFLHSERDATRSQSTVLH